MAAGYAGKLACFLIKDQFGDLVHSVCECLISRGQLSLPEIGSFTLLARPQLASCLLVLIQHNCVQAFKVLDEDNLEARLRYTAIVDHIVLRACFPLFVELIREKTGNDQSEELALGLLQHGRLTLEQLIKRDAECSNSEDAQSQFMEAFTNLLQHKLVERCPRPEAVLGFSDNAGDGRPAKKARGSSKKRSLPLNFETQVRRVLAAAAPMEAERFRGPSRWIMDEDAAASTPSTGEKRKHGALWDSSSMDEKEVLWRVNFEECVKLLRHKACACHVNFSFGSDAKTVVEAMLEATRKTETTVKAAFSDALTLNDILILRSDWTAPVVRNALKRMVEEGFINSVGDAGSHYTVAMQKIVELARKTEVESIVSQRFGKPSSRILRLLSKKGGSEQKAISEKCLIPDKEAWQLLYQLMKERYIELQEVPKSAGDRAPARTFYLWHVDFSKLSSVVLEDMYHAAYNLHRQIEHRLEHEKELLIIPTTGSLSNEQQQKLDRLQSIVKILEVSIFKLMNTIMLYDFY
ncbi:hypothetical protein SELMODRAFT_424745 [Selaginella moellendorffii]|uniref:DNA-directed RNA polymerase III subunit RPC3 n=1 Tax=Selaginella moellendorffii TaxID=88036 RepID=D8SQX4_SELML|nr:DNA-directed RNA polymerase III subunit RPC3 [Selaginella moellendorffii]EFJ13334.1 hypothetical protein SELMODRAFT_424745 [Selaginella moellendorffii]|eukprot:XP_002985756.1 DNA-directed RNA polymerase III subunit RPC3 [Selaginella moellendorffii]